MSASTVTRDYPVVKLQEGEILAGVRRDSLYIQHGYGQFPAVLNLTEAIKLATFVLRVAEQAGINVQEAAADVRMLPPDWDPEFDGGMQLRF